jgi:hypothetical protein
MKPDSSGTAADDLSENLEDSQELREQHCVLYQKAKEVCLEEKVMKQKHGGGLHYTCHKK